MLEKIDDKDSWNLKEICRCPEHDPPGYIVLENGTYRHTCPECGYVTVFTVNNPTLTAL